MKVVGIYTTSSCLASGHAGERAMTKALVVAKVIAVRQGTGRYGLLSPTETWLVANWEASIYESRLGSPHWVREVVNTQADLQVLLRRCALIRP